MNKKSGTAGTPVEPITPTAPHEADKADPGEVEELKAEQIKTKTGKYGSVKIPAFKPEAESAAADASSAATSGTEASSPAGSSSAAISDSAALARAPAEVTDKKKSWIEIELVGEDDKPIVGERYRITLPDGTAAEGVLDHKGFARVAGFDPGPCQVTFPDLDKEAWEEV